MNISKYLPEFLESKPSIDVHDPSKIQSYMRCPRGYFMTHILGIQNDNKNIHLEFGSAWHEAMEVFELANSGDAKTTVRAMKAFAKLYSISPEDDTNPQKNLSNAMILIEQYGKDNHYALSHEEETLYTEVVFTVPVANDRILTGKMDTIKRFKKDNSIRSKEHKTTGRLTHSWADKWQTKFQIHAYAYALKVLFGDDAKGVVVNGCVTHKNKLNYCTPIIEPTRETYLSFLFSINYWLDRLEMDMKYLNKAKETDTVLSAFPINGEGCETFGCNLGGLCYMCSNPLKKGWHKEPPAGYKIEYWNPNRDQKIKHNIDKNTVLRDNHGN